MTRYFCKSCRKKTSFFISGMKWACMICEFYRRNPKTVIILQNEAEEKVQRKQDILGKWSY